MRNNTKTGLSIFLDTLIMTLNKLSLQGTVHERCLLIESYRVFRDFRSMYMFLTQSHKHRKILFNWLLYCFSSNHFQFEVAQSISFIRTIYTTKLKPSIFLSELIQSYKVRLFFYSYQLIKLFFWSIEKHYKEKHDAGHLTITTFIIRKYI